MKARLAVCGFAVAVVSVACQEAAPDLEARRQALLAADSAWQAAAAAGQDPEAILAYWTEDAIVYPPGQPALRGKEAIRSFVSAALETPGFDISWETLDAELAASGDMGYLTHTNRVTAPDTAGNLVTTRGKGVTIWRMTEEGTWKCVVDIWNEAG